jgi:hypothetical protein
MLRLNFSRPAHSPQQAKAGWEFLFCVGHELLERISNEIATVKNTMLFTAWAALTTLSTMPAKKGDRWESVIRPKPHTVSAPTLSVSVFGITREGGFRRGRASRYRPIAPSTSLMNGISPLILSRRSRALGPSLSRDNPVTNFRLFRDTFLRQHR